MPHQDASHLFVHTASINSSVADPEEQRRACWHIYQTMRAVSKLRHLENCVFCCLVRHASIKNHMIYPSRSKTFFMKSKNSETFSILKICEAKNHLLGKQFQAV